MRRHNSLFKKLGHRLAHSGFKGQFRLRRIRRLGIERLESRQLLSAVPVGPETLVNTFTSGQQETRDRNGGAVAMDADGDYVITWSSQNQDNSSFGVYAQRFNTAGVAQGGEFRVNTATVSVQLRSTVAMDADGDFVIAWQSRDQPDAGYWGVYAQRYSATGVPKGIEFRVNSNTTNSQSSPSIAMDADGDFVVTWMSLGQDGSEYGVYAQRYNAAGLGQGSEFRVNTTTTGEQLDPTVAMDADGDFVITWISKDQDGSDFGVYAQRYNAAGVAQGGEFQVNTTTLGIQRYSTVAMDADGDFVVTWTSEYQDGSSTGIYAKRYNAAGGAQGGEFRVNTTTANLQEKSAVAMDENGVFVVTWTGDLQDGSGYGVYAQRYNAAGIAQGGEFQVNTIVAGDQRHSTVATDADGEFVVVWQSNDDSQEGVYARRYQPNIRPVLTSPTAITLIDTAVTDLFGVQTGTLSATDANLPAQTLTYGITAGTLSEDSLTMRRIGTFGTLTVTVADGSYSYAPNAAAINALTANRSESLSVTVSDGLISDSKALTVNILAENDKPIVASIGGAVTYNENSARVLVFPAATITDADTILFTGGKLTVTNTNGQSTDSLAVVPTGLVTVSGTNVLYNSAVIGNFTGGDGKTSLAFTFNISANAARIQLVLRAIGFASSSENPVTTARSIAVIVNDGLANGVSQSKQINVVSVNDKPVVASIGGAVTYTENAARVMVFPTATIVDADTILFTGGKLTLTNTNGQPTDSLAIAPASGVTVSGGKVLYQDAIIGTVAGGTGTAPLVFTFNSLANAARLQLVLRSIGFASSSENPVTTTRSIAVIVNDGLANSVSQSKQINVVSVNDKPVVASIGNAVTYTENTARVLVFPAATVTDVDTTLFTGGKLTVTNTSGQPTDSLAIVAANGVTVSGANVLYQGATIGSFAGGAGTTALVVTFNNQANAARITLVLRAIGFSSSSESPTISARSISIVANDGLANSVSQSKQVNVVSVNDVPVISAIGGAVTYTENGARVLVFPTATVTDVDTTLFTRGKLTVTNTNGQATDSLAIVAANGVAVSGMNVLYNTVVIGSFTGGMGTTPLVVTFNNQANAARVTLVLRAIGFEKSPLSPVKTSRSVSVIVNDGVAGGDSVLQSKLVNIVA